MTSALSFFIFVLIIYGSKYPKKFGAWLAKVHDGYLEARK